MSNPQSLQGWLALLEKRHSKSIDLGLQRCGEVYRQLGSPRPANTVYTVAGTNGKGSTVAYLSAFAGACGLRYGSYTSPHILEFNERISVMGVPVTDRCLVEAFGQVERARGEISLSYFEFTTLAGLLILNEAKLDCAILEVGLGGRLDTVNLIDTDCAVITPIGLDHQEYLGPDIETIAAEKAGIIRAHKPVVCSQPQPPLSITTKAKELNAPVYRRGSDFDLCAIDSSTVLFSRQSLQVQLPSPVLAGAHQLDNLAAALAAFSVLNPECFDNEVAIANAIKSCQLPGRMQLVAHRPATYVDVGHNPLAAQAVVEFFKARGIDDVICVLAMLADKDAEAVVSVLDEICSHWVCTASEGERAQSGGALVQRIQAIVPQTRVSEADAMPEAMKLAQSQATEQGTILVFGSFTTAAAYLRWQKYALAAKLS